MNDTPLALSLSPGLLGASLGILALAILCRWAYHREHARARATLWRSGWEELAGIGITRKLVVIVPPEDEGEVA